MDKSNRSSLNTSAEDNLIMWPAALPTTILAGLFLYTRCSGLAIGQRPLGGEATSFTFRDAVNKDLDDFITVLHDAFWPSAEWHYLYQFHDEYPGYTWQCLRQIFEPVFAESPANGMTIKVIEVPDDSATSGSRVVSFSLWQFNKTKKSSHSFFLPWSTAFRSNCSQHLDLNQTRAEPWSKVHARDMSKYLDDAYDRQAYLGGLATHPQWDGHGFAATHLRWGIALADEAGTPATLAATEAGYPLYRSFGFKDIHNITMERLDGKGIIWHEIMARPVPSAAGLSWGSKGKDN